MTALVTMMTMMTLSTMMSILSMMTISTVITISTIMTILTMRAISPMITTVSLRKLEAVHKEVGGCLISYNLKFACIFIFLIRKLDVI